MTDLFLALASWCAKRGGMHRRGRVFSGGFRSGGVIFSTRSIKTHARWCPIGQVWRHTVRDTDGLQTTITCSPVNVLDQTFSLELSMEMSLPVPPQDEHLPDQ